MASEVYGGGPNRGLAMQKVNGPAIGMMVTGGLGAAWSLLSVVLNLLGASVNMASLAGQSGGSSDALATMTSGALGVVFALLGLAINGAVIFGAMKMRALQSYPLALTAAILSCLPCIPCCCVSLPIGIWALVVLFDNNVKTSFV
jgi:hypothetical protein